MGQNGSVMDGVALGTGCDADNLPSPRKLQAMSEVRKMFYEYYNFTLLVGLVSEYRRYPAAVQSRLWPSRGPSASRGLDVEDKTIIVV